jgi:hypothetical protein
VWKWRLVRRSPIDPVTHGYSERPETRTTPTYGGGERVSYRVLVWCGKTVDTVGVDGVLELTTATPACGRCRSTRKWTRRGEPRG